MPPVHESSADSEPGRAPWDPNLAEVSGWLGGRHQPGSPSPGPAPRGRGGPGTRETRGGSSRLAREEPPSSYRGWVVARAAGRARRGRQGGRSGPGRGRRAVVPPGPASGGAAGQRPSAAAALRPGSRSPSGAPGAAGAVSLRSLPAPARRGEDSWALAI